MDNMETALSSYNYSSNYYQMVCPHCGKANQVNILPPYPYPYYGFPPYFGFPFFGSPFFPYPIIFPLDTKQSPLQAPIN